MTRKEMTGTMKKFYRLAAIPALLLCSPAHACEGCFDDWFAPYLQRYDGVTMSGGNGKDQNAISEIINPSPPYVRNRRLPLNGQRAVGAMERYRDTSKYYGYSKAPPAGGSSTTPPPPSNGIVTGYAGQ